MQPEDRPTYYSGDLPENPSERERILKVARDDADMQYHLNGLKRTAPLVFYIMVFSPFLVFFLGLSLLAR